MGHVAYDERCGDTIRAQCLDRRATGFGVAIDAGDRGATGIGVQPAAGLSDADRRLLPTPTFGSRADGRNPPAVQPITSRRGAG